MHMPKPSSSISTHLTPSTRYHPLHLPSILQQRRPPRRDRAGDAFDAGQRSADDGCFYNSIGLNIDTICRSGTQPYA
eukprot:5459953-Pleurochrysis_carterae.AAC.1